MYCIFNEKNNFLLNMIKSMFVLWDKIWLINSNNISLVSNIKFIVKYVVISVVN